jgi:hypothetical protein
MSPQPGFSSAAAWAMANPCRGTVWEVTFEVQLRVFFALLSNIHNFIAPHLQVSRVASKGSQNIFWVVSFKRRDFATLTPDERPLDMQSVQRQRWKQIADHIEKWFYAPDLEALRIAMSVAYAHGFPGIGEKPIYLFLVGPPGSGKTELVIESLSVFQNSHVVSKITKNSFLSGFRPGGKKGRGTKDTKGRKRSYSFLDRIGKTPILLFKDFTTFLSEDYASQKDIAGALRELWDGKYGKEVGSVDEPLEWEGKMTIIAACTGVLEKAWSSYHSMGDRFLTVRWRAADQAEAARHAVRQMGKANEIKAETHRLMKALISTTKMVKMPDPEPLLDLAGMVAWSRGSVERRGKEVLDVGEMESSTRIAMAMARIAQGHASLFHKAAVDEEDLALATRVGWDSVPSKRRVLLDLLPDAPAEVSLADLIERSGIWRNAVTATMDEMEALGIVVKYETGDDEVEAVFYKLSEKFSEVRGKARRVA